MEQFIVEKTPMMAEVPESVRAALVGLTIRARPDKPSNKDVFQTTVAIIEEALYRRGDPAAMAAKRWFSQALKAKKIVSDIRIGRVYGREVSTRVV